MKRLNANTEPVYWCLSQCGQFRIIQIVRIRFEGNLGIVRQLKMLMYFFENPIDFIRR